ncbi:transposable element Tcb2 transposase [Trichonephila clavipes]|nr:transposable element Tcb2 transposase [Trichonephila clavipes]
MSSDDNRACVRRTRGECINSAFALQRHASPIAGVMVWSTNAYDTRSPLILIYVTLTAQRYVHDILQPHVFPLMVGLSGAIFNKTMFGHIQQGCHNTISTPLPPFPGLLVTNRAYLR